MKPLKNAIQFLASLRETFIQGFRDGRREARYSSTTPTYIEGLEPAFAEINRKLARDVDNIIKDVYARKKVSEDLDQRFEESRRRSEENDERIQRIHAKLEEELEREWD